MPARKNRRKSSSLFLAGALLAFLGSAFFILPENVEAKERDVFIRRVQTWGATADEDFAEIENNENCAIDLSGWKLRKRTSSGAESPVKTFDGKNIILPPGETFLWANSKNDFSTSIRAHEESTAMLTDNNSLALFDASDLLVDSLSWGVVTKPFQTDEANVENPKAHETVIRASKSSMATIEKTVPPKGKTFDTTSFGVCGVSKESARDSSVVLSEIFANPSEDESEGEFIELENRNEKAIDLSHWKLRDASKTGAYVFPEETAISPREFLALSRKEFGFTLNNTDEVVTLEDPKGAVADTVSWNSARENISLARDGARWRATKYVTKGESNRFGNDPTAKTRLPKKGFANIPLEFSATVRDADGDPTKVTWDFGDGHRSYVKSPSHTYTKKGHYIATLRYTDGIADIAKTFRVDIKKYEAPKVRIVSLVPNPEGKDTRNEYLVIENRSKKEVNLKGWKIATKSKRTTKNFINHTVSKDFILKPDASKKLTAKYAAFTLGNTRQYLELRDPRGKAVQSLRYKLEKSAPDNAEFFKMPNHPWQWRNPLPLDTETKEM